jgi:hypothetical protein
MIWGQQTKSKQQQQKTYKRKTKTKLKLKQKQTKPNKQACEGWTPLPQKNFEINNLI